MSEPIMPSMVDPLPYRAKARLLLDAEGQRVGSRQDTVKFIARACNSYHDLLAACEAFEANQAMVDECSTCQAFGRICITHVEEAQRVRDLRRAAIAKAKGGTP